jgi:hypothetical protein
MMVILAVLVVFGGTMFNSVVRATGGTYLPKPFTAIGVADPVKNFTGFSGSANPRVSIYNGTTKSKIYHWRSVLKGEVRETGDIRVGVGETRFFRVSLGGTSKSDVVRVELVGLPQFVELQVYPHAPVSYIPIVPTTTSTTDLTTSTGDESKNKLKNVGENPGNN